jgi:hypothetical protein
MILDLWSLFDQKSKIIKGLSRVGAPGRAGTD